MVFVDFLQRCHDSAIRFSLQGEQVKVNAPKDTLTPDVVAQIRRFKPELMAWLQENAGARAPAVQVEAIAPRAPGVAVRASFGQEQLWLAQQAGATGDAYHFVSVLDLRGRLDLPALEAALAAIIERHEPLRTVFAEADGVLVQRVLPAEPCAVPLSDLSALPAAAAAQQAASLERELGGAPFDLARDLMLRVRLVRLDELHHRLVMVMHHIASDGWSLGVLIAEFRTLYAGHALSPLPVTYADYAAWLRESMQGRLGADLKAYWDARLQGVPHLHGIALDHRRPLAPTRRAGHLQRTLPAATVGALRRFAQERGATLFMALETLYAIVLRQHSQSDDMVIGTPVANRMHDDLAGLVGYFVNLVALRQQVDLGRSFTEVLDEARTLIVDAFAHQMYPFDEAVRAAGAAGASSHAPLVQVLFTLQNNALGELTLPDLACRVERLERANTFFDLHLEASETGAELALHWEYSTDLFSAERIARMAGQLERLIDAVLAAPALPLWRHQMLGDDERRLLLHDWNTTQADYPRDAGVHALFEAQAARSGDRQAVVIGGAGMSYARLNERANALAHYLITHGVKPGALVGLCAPRSLDMVVALLAILKAGGAYVPLDPAYPPQRLAFMVGDSGIDILLTHSELAGKLAFLADDAPTLRLISLDQVDLRDYPATDPAIGVDAAALAYVIYTSGSTGQPKGVMVEHRGVVRLATAADYVELGEQTVFLQAASVSFDAATLEIWGCLLNGGTLVLYPDDVIDLGVLNTVILEHGVNTMWLTAALFEQWSHALPSGSALKWILAGGDAISPHGVARVHARLPEAVVVNGYGPTENTTFTACYPVPRGFDATLPVPLGRPVGATTAYVLSAHGQLLPIGAIGELYTGGDGLARGYLNRPELTAERFVANPFGAGRLYRTGDLVRYLPDGRLDYIGRIDNQVKIRGFRVELGEIEHRLAEHPQVAGAVVLAREEAPGDKRLVAYVAASDHADLVASLRSHLRTTLPEHMVPSLFVVMDALPVTANGKVDKRALPAPGATSLTAQFTAPREGAEQQLAAIWSALLHLPLERIGAGANFFELGGHSLLAMRLLAEIRQQLGVELSVKDIFGAATLSELAALAGAGRSARPAVTARPRTSNRLPASFAQQRLWFIDRFDGGSAHYNMPAALRVTGSFDPAIAEQAVRRIIERHEPLRTVFSQDADGAWQVVRDDVRFTLAVLDLSSLAPAEQHGAVQAAARQDAATAFDLSNDIMLRARYLRLSDDDGVLLFNMHHIASDGWSMGVLVSEFTALYDALRNEHPNPLPPLPLTYADYAQWQRDWLQGEVLDRQLAYWEQQLANLPPVHELPLDRPRPARQTFNGASHAFTVNGATHAALRQLARDQQATLFMVLHGAFTVLLARHAGIEDIVIGTPVANRLQKELEGLIGFFVNTLVLRSDCSDNPSFIEHLARIRTVNLDAQANQDVPFEHLVERLKPVRSAQHGPLFQIMFSMNTNEGGDAASLQLDGLRFEPMTSGELPVKFDLILNASEEQGGLAFSLDYNTDLFDAGTIERMADHYTNLLHAIVENPSTPIRALAMLSGAERHHLLHTLNATDADYPRDTCVHQLFEAQAQRTPGQVAVTFEDASLTYGQLNERANRLAHYLRAQGVGAGALVGLCLPRSLDMVVAPLAVMKAGGAYLPLDPAYPPQRLASMAADSGIGIVLTHSTLAAQLPPLAGMIAIDQLSLADCSAGNPGISLASSALAYVVYTSGSTGQPKGVMVEHRGMVNLARFQQRHFGVRPDSRVLAFASPSFDAAVFEWVMALLNGATLYVCTEQQRQDAQALENCLIDQCITHATLPPALLPALDPQRGYALEHLILAGEAFSLSLVAPWQGKCLVHNAYGPTETTVCASVAALRQGDTMSIGRPIDNVRLYVLDASCSPVPLGATGELYIGGDGLARGYLNRPELTAERFLPNPFGEGRLYKTGDLVRYLPDGRVEYIGRIDDQVKMRGFRIELGEIENALARHPQVHGAVVVAHEGRLVAYVAATDHADLVPSLRSHAQAVLSAHMVPSLFVVMDALPVTANGKIDKRALPAPDASALSAQYTAPRESTEQQLAAIWSALLHLPVEQISAGANFFELGGHSLLAMRLVAEMRQQLGVELSVKDIFGAATLSELAALAGKGRSARPAVTARPRTSNRLPASFAQQRLWFIDRFDGGSAHYNMPAALRVSGRFDPAVAEQAFRRIIERHEPLRTVFSQDADGAWQIVRDQVAFTLARVDLGSLTPAEQQRAVHAAAHDDALTAFDLSNDVMLRARYLRLSDDDGVLLFNMHHIASDGWSMGVLVSEFTALYDALRAGRASPSTPLALTYADYAQWQRDWLQGEVLERQLAYWEQQLANLPPVHALPLDRPRPARQTFNGASQAFTADGTTHAALRQLARDQQATLFMVLHGAFTVLLARHAGIEDIVIGTPVANRLQKELEGLIGFFVNTLVLRSDCGGNPSFTEHLARIRTVNLDAQANQDVPFEHLVERLKPVRSAQHGPLFQIMFSMNTNEGGDAGSLQLDGLRFEPMTSGELPVKFDLVLNASEEHGGLAFSLDYNTDLFDAGTIERMADHYTNLLAAIVANPATPIRALAMLSSAERHYLLHTLNATAVDYPRELCAHHAFEAQAAQAGDMAAVIGGGAGMTYAQLNARANQLAHHLRAQGVGPGAIVGLCMPRGVDLIAGLLAVLKAGGAYLPLDPAYPPQRLAYMAADSGIGVVLTDSTLADQLSPLANVIAVDEVDLGDHPATNPAVALESSALAYVIYTSGSTGQPKGVMVEHRGMVNLARFQQRYFAVRPDSRVLAFASPSFDAAVFEWTMALLNGATLYVCTEQQRQDAQALENCLIDQRITHATLPPALLPALDPQRDYTLEHLILAGEAFSLSLAAPWQGKCTVHNAYGPTETTVCASATPLRQGDAMSIGRPLDNFQLYVLDASRSPVPLGSTGELYIGGDGLARGYLNRPELTAERFIPNPFGEGRLYRTGDLVRYLPDGRLDYIGRIDDQVKIRGFRIELGEIENALAGHPQVSGAVVVAQDARLIAYVAAADSAGLIATLRSHVQAALPAHMVPSVFVVLDALPVTANGKVDKRALPAPDTGASSTQYTAPREGAEQRLAAIWSALLHLPVEQISAGANFFDLGGHSLLAMRLLSEMRQQFGVELSVKDIFGAATLSELAALAGAGRSARAPVTARPRTSNRLPASFAQQRLWFIDRFDGGSAHYNMPAALRVSGRFDPAIAEQAVRRIIERHEPVRTVFSQDADGAWQVVRDEASFTLAVLDLSRLPPAERESAVQAAARQDATTVFDLSSDTMLRASYLRLSDDDGVLLLNMHHIASDGWSMGVLVREFTALYDALRSERPNPLPPLPLTYADYAQWQRDWLQGEVLDRQLAYWEQQLANLPPVHELPLDRPRPARQTFNGASHAFTADGTTQAALRQLARDHQATLFMVLHGAFTVLLARHAGNDDIVIGTPVANRLQKELEGLIGFFVNTLVLRSDCSGNPSFIEHLARIRTVNLDAQANQDVPFEHLVERLKPVRSAQHGPLFQIMFSMNTTEGGDAASLQLDGLRFEPMVGSELPVKFDLVLNASEEHGGLAFSLDYNTDLFDAGTIERMAGHYTNLLAAIVENPATPIRALAMLSNAERHHLLHTLNATDADYPRDTCVHQLFEAQAQRIPGQVAVTFEETSLTYAQLNERANRLAHYLRTQGVGAGSLVGLCVPRSLDMVVALLAIMKAGGAYVPLDPSYPRHRLDHMLEDAGPAVLLTHSELADVLSPHAVPVFRLDEGASTLAQYDDANPAPQGGAERLAYVIYTSGSTGKPKGVAISQRALTNFIVSMQKEPGIGARDVMINVTSLSFDIAALELYLPLVCGARTVLCSRETAANPQQLAQLMERHAVTMMQATPATWRMLVGANWPRLLHPLKVLCGGEALSATLARDILRHAPAIWNMYGPTETTIWSTLRRLTAQDSPAIGRPIANTRLYVLDSCLQPAPQGAAGELYIGGDGVAQGYLNRPELTAERFLANPFGAGRIYRTGDLVRYLPNGDLEYVGRIDDQVKVRGYRIELGEIEHQLAQHPDVAVAVVVARADGGGDKRLVAYVTAAGGAAPAETGLRAHLQASLPEFMVPSLYVVLDAFPLTPNGKIDRRALPAPASGLADDAFVPPQTDTELALAPIWSALLQIERVGATSNFFDLGGHSLLAVQLQGRVASVFQKDFKLKDVFDHPTLAAMAQRLDALELSVAKPVTRLDEKDYYHVSFKQKAEWIHNQINAAVNNPSWSYQYRAEIPYFSLAAIEQTMTLLIARHETLRTTFHVIDGALRQKVHPAAAYNAQADLVDLSHLDDARDALDAIERGDNGHRFDFGALYPFLLKLVKTASSHWLIFTIDHALADRQFIATMQEEFVTIYQTLLAGGAPALAPIDVTYKDYAEWEFDEIDGRRGAEHRAYWHGLVGAGPYVTVNRQIADHRVPYVYSYRDYIARDLGRLPLALDPFVEAAAYGAILGLGNSEAITRATRRYLLPIRDADYAALQARAAATSTPLSALMLSALTILLHRLSLAERIIVITLSGTRVAEQWAQVGGHMSNDILAVARFSDGLTVDALIAATRTQMLESDEHKIYPLPKLLHELDVSYEGLGAARFNFVGDYSKDTLPLEAGRHEAFDSFGFDLEVAVRGYGDGLCVVCDYRTDLFEPSTIEAMMDKLLRVARTIGHGGDVRIDSIDLSTPRDLNPLATAS